VEEIKTLCNIGHEERSGGIEVVIYGGIWTGLFLDGRRNDFAGTNEEIKLKKICDQR
jgi:hypothetical protein